MSAQFLSILIVITCTFCNTSSPDHEEPAADANEIQVKVLTGNLNYPWELVWGADGKIWMTEREGKVSRIDPASGKVTPVINISEVRARGEGGLLGMALHPDFPRIAQVFLAYDYEGDGYKEKIVRYTYNGSTLTEPRVILDDIQAAANHDGCRLFFSPDKKLFITTGDATDQSNPQNKNSLNGKVLRINPDGTIPPDNPFKGSPVWSYGHRNPQGLVFAQGKLYSSEHGPNNDDEINIITKGRNYGWPNVTGFCDEKSEKEFCIANNVVEPIQAWTPTLAVSGMDYYSNKAISLWNNSLLLTTLKDNTLYQLKLNESGDKVIRINEYLRGKYGRLRDVCVAPDGKVYVCTCNGSNDKILVITPNN